MASMSDRLVTIHAGPLWEVQLLRGQLEEEGIPAFLPDDTGPEDLRTMAELRPDEKHAISHRGRAARAMAAHLRSC